MRLNFSVFMLLGKVHIDRESLDRGLGRKGGVFWGRGVGPRALARAVILSKNQLEIVLVDPGPNCMQNTNRTGLFSVRFISIRWAYDYTL